MARRKKLDETPARVINLIALDAALIMRRLEARRDEMFTLFRQDERFEELPIDSNPFPVKTERERAVEDKDLPVFRTMFQKVV